MFSSIANRQKISLRVRFVDYVASGLLSLLLVCGTIVVGMGLMWLIQSRQLPSPPNVLQVTGILGQGDEANAASAAEISVIDESVEPSEVIQISVESVEQLATNVIQAEADASSTSSGRREGEGNGENGVGLATGSGRGGELQRWNLIFEARDQAQYAQLLDQLGVELACIGGGVATIQYINDVSSKPTLRSGERRNESRMYLLWSPENSGGPLLKYEQSWVEAAGVTLKGRTVLRFLSEELRGKLLDMESAWADERSRTIDQVQVTVFRMKMRGEVASIEISAQHYR